jgi:hypothetical protein
VLDGDEFVAELFGLPLEFGFEPFLPLRISGCPDCFVVFDLMQNHRVKDHGDFVCSRCRLHPYARFTNVTNTDYQPVYGVVMPGRAALVGIEWCVLGKPQ